MDEVFHFLFVLGCLFFKKPFHVPELVRRVALHRIYPHVELLYYLLELFYFPEFFGVVLVISILKTC